MVVRYVSLDIERLSTQTLHSTDAFVALQKLFGRMMQESVSMDPKMATAIQKLKGNLCFSVELAKYGNHR